MCDYDRLIDPVNNLYNNILVNCKYYDNFQFNVLSKKENTGLSIIHFNARSLNANFDHIKDFLCTLNTSAPGRGMASLMSPPKTRQIHRAHGIVVRGRVAVSFSTLRL